MNKMKSQSVQNYLSYRYLKFQLSLHSWKYFLKTQQVAQSFFFILSNKTLIKNTNL